MNELYGEKKKSSKRRLFYIAAVILVLAVVLKFLPQGAVARLAFVVAADNPAELTLSIPKDCFMEKVYLRSKNSVPKSGKLFTLSVNNVKFEVKDLEKLELIEGDSEPDMEKRTAPVDWAQFKDHRVFNIVCIEINPEIKRYDLDLVFEIRGNPDTIKDWQKFVQLKRMSESFSIKALPEKNSVKSK